MDLYQVMVAAPTRAEEPRLVQSNSTVAVVGPAPCTVERDNFFHIESLGSLC